MLRLLGTISVSVGLLTLSPLSCYLIAFLASALYLLSGGWKWLRILSKTFKRDMYAIKGTVSVVCKLIKAFYSKKLLRDFLEDNVKKIPNKVALIDADTKKSLTFKETQMLCHKIANIFHDAGYRKGDVVALYMENRVEYMPIWLAFTMLGVITSLININLRGDSLKHCINVCNCNAIIFSGSLQASIKEIQDDLKHVKPYLFDPCDDAHESWVSLSELLATSKTTAPARNPSISPLDTILYMYTSGTTGLPKAVLWGSFKNTMGALGWSDMFECSSNDTLYNALPLYHGNGMVFTSNSFLGGGTTVLKKKFSASQFMEDCCKYNVTVINYIGEICRYLLATPPSLFDQLNTIRVASGNGMRASIWKEFQSRFDIETIMELYNSTEGTIVMYPNNVGKVGAVGYRPLLLPNRDLMLVQIDKETGDIVRDGRGLAVEAKIGEPGQVVGRISKQVKFEGYTNEMDTKKKIAHDIFRKGDSVYLSGDVLVKDEEGFYYFQDRMGDTFRWKGENVSTNEVEGLMSKLTDLKDVCVYGVEIPGNEGKAGMACISDPDKQVVVRDLPFALGRLLPKYAIPQFLRFANHVDVTGTYKFQKNKLRKENYNPSECGEDEIYHYDRRLNQYLKVDHQVYEDIMNKVVTF